MGIAKAALSLLFEFKATNRLSGTVCQLGRQTINVTPRQFVAVARRFAFDKVAARIASAGKIDDVVLFKALGFEAVESIDYSDYESPTHVLDFNNPVPLEFHGKYDLIFDGGTTEHIFNLPQCLKNIHNMLKPGGVVIHASPSTNHVDHGFYMFSPTLFYDWYMSNRFEIVKSYIAEYPMNPDRTWIVYDYQPGSLNPLSFVGLGSKRLLIWFAARKLEQSTCDVVPQQGSYLKVWEAAKAETAGHAMPASRAQALKRYIQENRWLNALALAFYVPYRRIFRSMPRIVARY